MNTNKHYWLNILTLAVIFFTVFTISARAASTPTLTLGTNGSMVTVNVRGADQYATVLFYYPNDATYTTFTSIDLGQTDANGSFSVSLAANSYGLNGGWPVYVSVDKAVSERVNWVGTSAQTVQNSGSLTLSQQNITLTAGQNSNIVAMNTSNALSVSSNTDPTVASAIAVPGNMIYVNAIKAGSTAITICATTNGCSTANITVQAPTQKVSFSQLETYVVVGQSTQTINVYGPGSYYGLSNSNSDAVNAVLTDSNLVVSAIKAGRAVISLCATGWQCGSVTVNALAAGSSIPNPTSSLPAPDYTNKPPQLASFAMYSNNNFGSFFGQKSMLTINFTSNQSVTNVHVKIGGTEATVTQNSNGSQGGTPYGSYNTSYTFTGNETLPLPMIISFENASSQVGQYYLSIGNSPTNTSSAPANSASTNSSSNSLHKFSKTLSMGMTKMGVSDPDVVALQNYLKNMGLYSGPITGYFGPMTKSAVQAYQKKHGLSQLGSVGPATRSLLNQGK